MTTTTGGEDIKQSRRNSEKVTYRIYIHGQLNLRV